MRFVVQKQDTPPVIAPIETPFASVNSDKQPVNTIASSENPAVESVIVLSNVEAEADADAAGVRESDPVFASDEAEPQPHITTTDAKRINSVDSDVIEASASDDVHPEVSEKMAALERGVDVTSGELVTVGDVYLMLGLPERVSLEYEWVDDVKRDDILGTSFVSNLLRRLADLSRAFMTDLNTKTKPTVIKRQCSKCIPLLKFNSTS